MKRNVAILGPTPAFVRWAVWHPCPFRPLQETRFVDQAYRALRGIREVGLALKQQRCIDGFCFRAIGSNEAQASDGPVPLGFEIEDVTAVFGGLDSVEQECKSCPANLLASHENDLAGCFGFLAADGTSLEARLAGITGHRHRDLDLTEELDRLLARDSDLGNQVAELFDAKNLAWYQIWKNPVLRGEHLRLVAVVLQRLSAQVGAAAGHCGNTAEALGIAADRQLSIRVELIPSGFSDGETWQLDPSCPDCRWQPGRERRQVDRCLACGRVGGLPEGQKFKVLGLRPYVRLASIIGESAQEDLWQRLCERKNGLD